MAMVKYSKLEAGFVAGCNFHLCSNFATNRMIFRDIVLHTDKERYYCDHHIDKIKKTYPETTDDRSGVRGSTVPSYAATTRSKKSKLN